MPKRIQRKRTKGWRLPDNAISVGRPGRWGNPFRGDNAARWFAYWSEHRDQTASQVVRTAKLAGDRLHCDVKKWLHINGEAYFRDAHRLAGIDLACWCSLDDPCHADVLLRIANHDRP